MLTIPSVGQVYKYSGIPGFIVFTSVFAAFIFLIDKKWNRLNITLSNRNIALALTISIVVFLFGIFVVIYPDANAGLYGGGSDADDALKIGAEAILNLQNPYHLRTYLDLPITPGLGAISLSIPFYLLGNVSYQNFFWLFFTNFLHPQTFRGHQDNFSLPLINVSSQPFGTSTGGYRCGSSNKRNLRFSISTNFCEVI